MTNKPNVNHDPKWKKFEKIVTAIHIVTSQGAEVKFNDKIKGKRSGEKWQVDVSIRYKSGLYSHLALIECKDTGRLVGVKEVQAFVTKMEDIGANKGVMVAAKGFQKGAKKTAEAYGVELYTLKEEPSSWLGKIVKDVAAFAFSVEFSIKADTVEKHGKPVNPSIEDFVFYGADGRVTPLTDMVMGVMAEMNKKGVNIPFKYDLTLDPPLSIHLPDAIAPTTAYGVSLLLGRPETKTIQLEFDANSNDVNYVYENVLQPEKHTFSSDKLPFGIDTTFEPGKYYVNDLGMKYRCISLLGEQIQLMLLDHKQWGKTISALIRIPTNASHYYRPMNDPAEEKRLEKMYQRLGRN